MKKLVLFLCLTGGFLLSLNAGGEEYRGEPWFDAVPHPVYQQDERLVELYYATWKIADTKRKEQPGLPQTPYMDEGLWDDVIWIWDTAFMSLFCKYAPDYFPGVESLRNFYVTLHDEGKEASPLTIWHTDNPPLFAWVEHDNYLFTDDRGHIEKLISQDRYLQRHYDWFNRVEKGWRYKGGPRISAPVYMKQHSKGYSWNGIASGMDNTPRGRGPGQHRTLWVDALAQQGLSALYISRLHNQLGDAQKAQKWMAEYDRIKELINRYYWDEKEGFYYDIRKSTLSPVRVMTPASFWPLLAEMADDEQAARMVEQLENPETLGGNPPTVTLARNDRAFKDNGTYWKGSIWLPTSYMTIKAIEKYGYHELAARFSLDIVNHMAKTYREYEPNTIWECYSPTEAEPARNADGIGRSREDFCGWSALGPISLFIENIIGFHRVDAQKGEVEWLLRGNEKNGIRNLRFGNVTTDIIYDGGKVNVTSNQPYLLIINGKKFSIEAGRQDFSIQ